jgi:CheY-like chemotaxis protein
MTGIDAIIIIMEAFDINLLNGVTQSKDVIGMLSSMKVCVDSIRDTNHFMLMSINKCIDYTKASKGLKLTRSYETIGLLQCMGLPLNCMKNIQNKVSIVLQEIPSDICSHLITDKLWLQENVLCLLSNAVKYSSGGTVSISVSLVDSNTLIGKEPKYGEISKTRHNATDTLLSIGGKSQHVKSKVHPDIETNNRSSSHMLIGDCVSCSEVNVETRSDVGTEMMVLIEVVDEGIGIPEEYLTSLFCPFKQTQRLAGGTGLGLYSLSKRVEALHGCYGVKKRSDGKQGSNFWFAIPYRPDYAYASNQHPTSDEAVSDSVPAIESVESLPETPINYRQGLSVIITPAEESMSISPRYVNTPTPLSILIAEDSPTISKMTAMLLSRHGHLVELAENGEIAFKKVTERLQVTDASKPAFDVVLMDLQMPVMDGIEATKRIRSLEESAGYVHPKQVIFGLSADWDEETSTEAEQVGIDVFLQKPFNLNKFYSSMQRCRRK